ncbi:MAG: lipoyl(octanoyl) transferase LipB [Bacteroidota bacterium]
MPQPAAVCHLGRTEYEAAWDLQRRVQERLIDAKRAEPAEALPHVLLVVEHPHVFTLGKSGDRAHLLADEALLAQREASFVPVDRGGDITYHGPGQLVAYPVLDLDRLRYPDGDRATDIHRYLRTLEEAVIQTCADYGLEAGRVAGRTGVWIDAGTERERKVCAFGVRCSRWVTMHGLALNLNTDLSYFGHIVPCGIADRGVTSLAAELGRPVDEAEATGRLLHHLTGAFGLNPTEHASEEAYHFFAGIGVTSGAAAV